MTIENFSLTPIIVLIIQVLLAWALWSIRRAFVREETYEEDIECINRTQQTYNTKISYIEGQIHNLEDRITRMPDAKVITQLAGTVESLRGDLKALDMRITGLDRLIQRIEHALDRQNLILHSNQASN